MGYSTNANYRKIDVIELDMFIDEEIELAPNLSEYLISGKPLENINKELLVEMLREQQYSSEELNEIIESIKKDIGLILDKTELLAA